MESKKRRGRIKKNKNVSPNLRFGWDRLQEYDCGLHFMLSRPDLFQMVEQRINSEV